MDSASSSLFLQKPMTSQLNVIMPFLKETSEHTCQFFQICSFNPLKPEDNDELDLGAMSVKSCTEPKGLKT
jgi:hypothetical protein